MTYYCPQWTENLTDTYPNHVFEDGDDCDDIYVEARCSVFEQRGTFVFDYAGDQIDSFVDDYAETTCRTHDREVTWDTDYSVTTDLRLAGFFVCEDCDQTYHTLEAHDEHLETHEDIDDDSPSVYLRPAYHGVRTSHSGWAS